MGCRIAVFGTGYLGATHAACMAELGHEVMGIDNDANKIGRLSKGSAPFFEPGLDALLSRNIEQGRLRFTLSYAEAAEFADYHFIAVSTPQKRGDYAADVSYVDAVIRELAPLLTKPAVVFGKSTVPVGTAARLAALTEELSPASNAVQLAWNPEFLREGFAVQDTLRPDRIVLGVARNSNSQAEHAAREIYAEAINTNVPFLVTDYETAELVKTAANAFLATKISFINAMADVCEAAGADVNQLADAIGYDIRIGRRFLNAGIGFGGGCLPKDIRAFMARAGELGASQALTLLREVDSINMRRRTMVMETARDLVGGSLIGKRIAILGAAFKPDSDDIRDSPALNIAGQIQLQGAAVTVYDPKALGNSRSLFPTLHYAESAVQACADADLTLVLTEWEEFKKLNPSEITTQVRSRQIFDGRNCLNPEKWRSAGWAYYGVGRR